MRSFHLAGAGCVLALVAASSNGRASALHTDDEGSIPSVATSGVGLVVRRCVANAQTRVRFPYAAPI